jgi:hypothetical protein
MRRVYIIVIVFFLISRFHLINSLFKNTVSRSVKAMLGFKDVGIEDRHTSLSKAVGSSMRVHTSLLLRWQLSCRVPRLIFFTGGSEGGCRVRIMNSMLCIWKLAACMSILRGRILPWWATENRSIL